ncbi:MAG: hypothetical protein HYW09_00625, partial [Candidatus Niyogibacteria bacterium]|nr:hypothetical protein [Candidatus Niyogibacteria bacterium]
ACGGKEECDVYCSEESHFNECLDFAEAAGFIAPEEVEMARKTGGKGPGNCRGREECEGFCQNPANQETCFSFAKEHGLISEEDLKRMEEGKQQILEMVDSAPPEVKSCLEGIIDVEGIRSGAVSPSESAGDNIRQCFEQFMPKPEGPGPNGEFPEGFQPPEGFEGGPPPGFEGGFPPGFEGGQPPEGFKPPEDFMPPEGFKPPEGMMPPEGFVAPEGSGELFQQQYQQQFEQQYQQQGQQQFEQQYQQQYQQQFQQQEQQLQQQFQQPPPSEPTSKINTNILGAVVAPFLQLLGFQINLKSRQLYPEGR